MAKVTLSLILLRKPCSRRELLINTTSPNQQGVEKLDSEVVWIFTELSAILVMPTSLLRTVVCFLFKEAYFYADCLPVTSRCAIRGIHGLGKGRSSFVNRDGKPANGIFGKGIPRLTERDVFSLLASAPYSESPDLVASQPSKKPDNNHGPNHL